MFSDPPFDAVDSCDSRDDVGRLLGGGWVLLVGLVEKEVGGELLVLVAGEVSLDGLVAVETEAAQLFTKKNQYHCHPQRFSQGPRSTYTLDSIALLLSHGNRLSSRGKRSIVVAILTEQTQKLLRVLGNQLSQLRVASAKLLQDGLEHLWLLLDHLAELLELRVVPEELQVAHASLLSSSRLGDRGGGTTASSVATSGSTALRSGEVE